MSLNLVHVELKEANEFIRELHRHHKPVVGHRFSVGCMSNGKLVGVAVVGRPVARMCDAYTTLEVTRLCTDGTKNVCSFLYAACARAGKALGYRKIQTYILETESGKSVESAGWILDGETEGGNWERQGRPRRQDQPQCKKKRYIKELV